MTPAWTVPELVVRRFIEQERATLDRAHGRDDVERMSARLLPGMVRIMGGSFRGPGSVEAETATLALRIGSGSPAPIDSLRRLAGEWNDDRRFEEIWCAPAADLDILRAVLTRLGFLPMASPSPRLAGASAICPGGRSIILTPARLPLRSAPDIELPRAASLGDGEATVIEPPSAYDTGGPPDGDVGDDSEGDAADHARPENEIPATADTPGRTQVGGRHDTPASTASPITPLEALRHQELASTARFVWLIVATAVVILAVLPLLGGDPRAKRLFAAGLLLAAGAALGLGILLEDEKRHGGLRAAACWGLCTLGALAGVHYFGVLSVAPAFFCLGIYVVALGQSRATSVLVYGMSAAGHGGLSALTLTGAIGDRGLMNLAATISPGEAVIVVALVQASLVASLVVGWSSRRAKLSALRELERTKREAVARQGLIEEAREDLDRALRLGQSGRFTERRIGSYRLGAVIGRGSMGAVYEAAHVETGSLAAIKLIQPELLERAENRTRFARELAIAASLKMPHVVRVLAVSHPDAPTPYLAMERLFGHNLNDHLREGGRLPPAEAVTLARQVARGIDAAARAGIIHRDLKPQNLFLHEPLGRPPIWKILDFGVSKLAESGDTLTHGRIIGTPVYMAPEQAQGRSLDSRADVYALGAILYRALTGRRPFDEGDVAQTLFAVVYSMPPRPSDLGSMPPEVDAVLAVALAKQRQARFQSALELAEALDQAMDGKLAPATEMRARALLREMPWGTTAPVKKSAGSGGPALETAEP